MRVAIGTLALLAVFMWWLGQQPYEWPWWLPYAAAIGMIQVLSLLEQRKEE